MPAPVVEPTGPKRVRSDMMRSTDAVREVLANRVHIPAARVPKVCTRTYRDIMPKRPASQPQAASSETHRMLNRHTKATSLGPSPPASLQPAASRPLSICLSNTPTPHPLACAIRVQIGNSIRGSLLAARVPPCRWGFRQSARRCLEPDINRMISFTAAYTVRYKNH